MTRTHTKHLRAYVDGYDLSGYERQVASMGVSYDVSPDAAFTDEAKNIILGQPTISLASLDGFLDNDAAGKFALASAGIGTRNVMVAIGVNAAPAMGDPVFAWEFEQTGYPMQQGDGFVAASLLLGNASYASKLTYSKPWGVLMAPKAARTAVNDATGYDGTAASTAGGIFVYHLFSSDGTVTLKLQDADANLDGSFGDLTGATSGSVDASASPKSGMVALATDASVDRYLRWQLVFGTATTATFSIAFIRG
jgi:hypothetical protein